MTRWVVDTSPLILAKLNRLDLIRNGADEVLAPPAVVHEVRMHPDAASRKIDEALSAWLKVRPVEDLSALEILAAAVDSGEPALIRGGLPLRITGTGR
jgi:predicted nucleic acid-binding protein